MTSLEEFNAPDAPHTRRRRNRRSTNNEWEHGRLTMDEILAKPPEWLAAHWIGCEDGWDGVRRPGPERTSFPYHDNATHERLAQRHREGKPGGIIPSHWFQGPMFVVLAKGEFVFGYPD